MASDRDGLDRLLDAAIADYSAEAPRLGIEKRVLASALSLEPYRDRPNRWWRGLGLLGPGRTLAAACVLLAISAVAFWSLSQSLRPHVPGRAIRTSTSAPKPTAVQAMAASEDAPVATASVPVRRRIRPASHRLPPVNIQSPTPDVFPTPAPLTAEERNLVVLTAVTQKDVQQFPSSAAVEPPPPIKIAAIDIEPLPSLSPPPTTNDVP